MHFSDTTRAVLAAANRDALNALGTVERSTMEPTATGARLVWGAVPELENVPCRVSELRDPVALDTGGGRQVSADYVVVFDIAQPGLVAITPNTRLQLLGNGLAGPWALTLYVLVRRGPEAMDAMVKVYATTRQPTGASA